MKYLQCCLSIDEHTSPFQKMYFRQKFSTIYLRINQPKQTTTNKNLKAEKYCWCKYSEKLCKNE